MDNVENPEVSVEYSTISDKDSKPSACTKCEGDDLICRTHQFVDRQDLGTPSIKRIQRHEWVFWECKKCGNRFSVKNPAVEFDCSFTHDVKEYVFKRVLNKGDSATRVAGDLKDLHNVSVDVTTVLEWIQKRKEQDMKSPTEGKESQFKSRGAKVICLDGTFKAVSPKKNDLANAKDELSCLHLTRLKNGRLVATWQSESGKKKQFRF
jgi:hypothetical protein